MTERNTAFTRDLPLPDSFSGGQIFAFSGMAGANSYRQDLCGVLTGEVGEIRFDGSRDSSVLLRFTESAHDYDAVLPDLIAADGGAILVTFADAQTIVGRSDTTPCIRPENEEYVSGSRTVRCGDDAFSLAVRATDGGVCFALCRRTDDEIAEADAQAALSSDADALAQQVLDWYQACPPCPNPHFETLWYKCLSVNRVNVFTPQDGFVHAFTTPERLPRRDLRIWDACFHATAMVHYAPELAKQAVLAVMERRRADGRIPDGQSGDMSCDPAQPPVLCAAVWNLFEVTGDVGLLEETAEPLLRYLLWLLKNRRSQNGLMTLAVPDAAEPIDSVGFSALMMIELQCMHRILMTLGNHMSAMQINEMSRTLAERINARLWDERSHCYNDRTQGGAFRRTITAASFLPLYAGVCDPRQAHRLVAHLTPLLDLPFPIPSASHDNGVVSMPFNYYVYVGLQRYGFGKQAALLRQKTLEGADRTFRKTGRVCALYDAQGGDPPRSDSGDADSNRSASFIELFLWS